MGASFLPWVYRSRLSGSAFSFAVPLPLALLLPSVPRPSGAPGACCGLFLFLRPAVLIAVLAVFLRGVLELLDAASQAAHQFGDLPAAEQEQYDQQDKYELGRAEEQGDDGYVMVYSGLWCVRFPSGLPLPYSRTRGLPADKCTKNFRNPAFPGEKKRTWLRIPIPNRGNPRVSTPGRQPAFCGSGTGAS